jgi:hypothetical protein
MLKEMFGYSPLNGLALVRQVTMQNNFHLTPGLPDLACSSLSILQGV